MKTLVKEKHAGCKANGADHCYTRWAYDGLCSGVAVARWLNEMGADEEPYGSGNHYRGGVQVTNGDVRRNWLRDDGHIEKA